MSTLIVVNNPAKWPLDIPGVRVVSAKSYLTEPEFAQAAGAKVFNLCRHYAYQSMGYYVSLLAEARGQRPMPDIATIMNLRSLSMPRGMAADVEEEIQKSLAPLKSNEFTLSIYFGRNMANRYERLALTLFNLFPAPFLRAAFKREESGWVMAGIGTISLGEVPDSHKPFIVQSATEYLQRKRLHKPRRSKSRYELAILFDAEEKHSPSCPRAIKRFSDACWDLGINTELIDRNDYGRLAEFDALFIRQTTAVNHHTYRFARRAQNLGLVVMDDPRSILRCTNKVYLAELLQRNNLPGPRTLIVHEDNIDEVARVLGLPCVLKRPDGAFSQGVMKAADESELRRTIEAMLQDSDLLIAQEFVPTEFDWRVGVLDKRALYVCRYHMARQHWQIAKHEEGTTRFGRTETLAVEEAPADVVKVAVKAANLIGDGLYGVDVKVVGDEPYIIEINDNPNLDAGTEDAVLKEDLWRRLAGTFLRRIEAARVGLGNP
ncbi:MAG: RimK family protein [Planctomycetes bacterium]|nr:RimK family protein [Planctomycetota bacterium]